jgi:hypothetical protein
MLYIISQSDGDTRISVKYEDQFLKELADGYWGEDPQFVEIDGITDTRASSIDPNYWVEYSLLVIRGSVVVPKPKVITKIEGWSL